MKITALLLALALGVSASSVTAQNAAKSTHPKVPQNGLSQGAKAGLKDGLKYGLKDGLKNGLALGLKNGGKK